MSNNPAVSAVGPILRTDDLQVSYGSTRVLFGIDLEIAPGSVLTLLGPNGAGKSTFARAISGLIPAKAGRIEYDGVDVTNWPAHRRRRAGLAYIPEGRGIFPGLSVLENLRMSCRGAGSRATRSDAIEHALAMFPILDQRRGQRAGSLSGGEQQMLALAGALTTTPKLIIADEMSLGLAPLVVEQVFQGIEAARQSGVAVLLIEQFVHRALAMADTCAILGRGQVGWQGSASDAHGEVLDRYLGDNSSRTAAAGSPA